jgi:hypothetical protein
MIDEMRIVMSDLKKQLTNEKLAKRFGSLFDLVNYAIEIAQGRVHSGRTDEVRHGVRNPAYQILADISSNRERIEDILESVEEDTAQTQYVDIADAPATVSPEVPVEDKGVDVEVANA